MLRLVNAMLLTHAGRSPGELSAEAAELSSRLNVARQHWAEPGGDQEEWERTAIRALLEVLEGDHAARLAELAVFTEEIIPARWCLAMAGHGGPETGAGGVTLPAAGPARHGGGE